MSAPKEQSETPNKRARAAQKPVASVNMEELRELIALLRDNGLAELELENEGIHVRLRRDSALADSSHAAPPPPPTPIEKKPATTVPAAEPSHDQDVHIIASPIVGTFYRSPSPSADPFVKIGSHVEPETVVCIIEAMKLMNEIQAETGGDVVKIYVENGQPVEYGQPLFGIRT